jgi:hypothetical protein
MTEHESQFVETLLARYRPVDPPPGLLSRVEQAASQPQRIRHASLSVCASTAAEIALGLLIRGLITAAGPAALLLISAKGH